MKLSGKKVAFLATDGVEQSELSQPWDAVKAQGAEVVLVSLESGEIQGMEHDKKGKTFKVDKTIDQASASDFDGLVLPGGVSNPDTLRTNEKAVEFVRDFFKQKKPVSSICHGPWMLVEADVLKGRTITSWPSLKTDIKNAGATWVDKEVCVDQGLTTSRNPDDLEAFCRKTVEELCEGKHEKQAA
tara:strand:- start:1345 stop:1902 length:558 start_codon:yes stop_codon:yes gene_type:complete